MYGHVFCTLKENSPFLEEKEEFEQSRHTCIIKTLLSSKFFDLNASDCPLIGPSLNEDDRAASYPGKCADCKRTIYGLISKNAYSKQFKKLPQECHYSLQQHCRLQFYLSAVGYTSARKLESSNSKKTMTTDPYRFTRCQSLDYR